MEEDETKYVVVKVGEDQEPLFYSFDMMNYQQAEETCEFMACIFQKTYGVVDFYKLLEILGEEE